MSDQVDIKISPDLVRGIIETKVQAAIAEALDGSVVERVVAAALSQPVKQHDGKPCRKGEYGSEAFVDYLCRDIIQQAATAAVKSWAGERTEELRKEFERQLATKKTSSMMVRACVDGLVGATQNRWSFSVNFPKE